MGDVEKVLEEFAGYVLVARVLLRQLQGNDEEVQAIHRHPARAVRLLDVPAGRQRVAAVENSDVVESQETALKNVLAFPVLPVDPPSEVQQQLLKDPLEEDPVRAAEHLFLDFVNPPCGPGVHRGIHVIESPLVGGELPVRVHVPLAREQDELLLCEVRVDHGKRNAVEREIPRGKPRILPVVRHREDVVNVNMRPLAVAAALPAGGWGLSGRIAVEPRLDDIMVKLLGPEHPYEGLTRDGGGT